MTWIKGEKPKAEVKIFPVSEGEGQSEEKRAPSLGESSSRTGVPSLWAKDWTS